MTTKKYWILTLTIAIMSLALIPAFCEENDAADNVTRIDLLANIDPEQPAAEVTEIGDFKIFDFTNPSKNVISYDNETKELKVSANYERGAVHQLPDGLFKQDDETQTEYWEYSMMIRMTAPTDDEWARLINSGVQFLDGERLLAQFKVLYWNQRQDNGVMLSIFNGDQVNEKYLLGKFSNDIYPDKPADEHFEDMMRVYEWMTTKVKLSFKITADGNVTINYGNDTLTGKIDGFDIGNSAPALKILGIGDAGQNVTYISNLIFSYE